MIYKLKTLFLGLIVFYFGLAPTSHAALWYVSQTVATSGDGKSWSTAWKNSSNITWGSILPGDTIFFDGGPSGLSYGAFSTITASGTATNYITIARSLESGRDGIVTFATPTSITGSYIKFDGGGYKQVSGNTYRTGIVFTCNSAAGSFTGGQAVNITGQMPIMRYVYFNGTYGAGSGNSFGVRNSTGFQLDHCWFYQSSYEDQMSWSPSATGGKVTIDSCVFQDNNKPSPEATTPHRDVINTWTGSGGYDLIVKNSIFFNTPGHSTKQPQGDEFLLQDSYSGSAAKLGNVHFFGNVCYGTARLLAFGSSNSGATSIKMSHNTVNGCQNGDSLSYTATSPAGSYTGANNIGNGTNPGFINPSSPLGADGIPFTADDGFNLTATATNAINKGTVLAEVPTDIRGNARVGAPDLGAYEFNGSAPTIPQPPTNLRAN